MVEFGDGWFPRPRNKWEPRSAVARLQTAAKAAGRDPATLKTEADWIGAGEIVFDAPLVLDVNFAVEDVRSAAWLAHTGAPVAAGGTLPWFQYVVRKKGVVCKYGNSGGFKLTKTRWEIF